MINNYSARPFENCATLCTFLLRRVLSPRERKRSNVVLTHLAATPYLGICKRLFQVISGVPYPRSLGMCFPICFTIMFCLCCNVWLLPVVTLHQRVSTGFKGMRTWINNTVRMAKIVQWEETSVNFMSDTEHSWSWNLTRKGSEWLWWNVLMLRLGHLVMCTEWSKVFHVTA